MSNTRTLVITEIALAIALAAVLNFLQIRLPINFMGGSVNLSMLPIALVALRRGALSGMVAGAIFGVIDFFVEPFFLVPIQVLLDYPLPYLLFGLGVGLCSKLYTKYASRAGEHAVGRLIGQGSLIIIVALIFGGILRLVPHVLSGVFFFAEYAADFFASAPAFLVFGGPVDAGLNVWIYSIAYNATYVVPSLVCVGICLLVIAPVLAKAVPVRKQSAQRSQSEEPKQQEQSKQEDV